MQKVRSSPLPTSTVSVMASLKKNICRIPCWFGLKFFPVWTGTIQRIWLLWRRRLNSSIGAHITWNGGCYIRYPDFKTTNQFISTDGVHLTKLGNAIFLNTIQGGLETIFLSNTGGVTYPNNYVWSGIWKSFMNTPF